MPKISFPASDNNDEAKPLANPLVKDSPLNLYTTPVIIPSKEALIIIFVKLSPLGSEYIIGLFAQYVYKFKLNGSSGFKNAHASC